MQGLELIKKAFALEEVERIPWVPFVGCHGGELIHVNATEYLTSADHMVAGAAAAMAKYKPDGLPVMFDLQVEAEVLGCKLQWADENPPAVISHPLTEGVSLEDLKIPTATDGRIAIAIEATKRMRAAHPDIALYGLITGPFTLALHLLGTDIFMKMFEDPDYINKVFAFTTDVAKAMATFYIEAGCDVIAVVDPMTSQIDPISFESFVSPPAKAIFDHVRNMGALSSFFVCGHAQQNIEVMCKTGPDNVSIDENIPLDFVKDIALKNNVSFGGNMKLTVVLLMGNEEDSQRDALECMDLGGMKGFVLAPGCDLAMKTPPANLEAVAKLVHDPYHQDVVRAMGKKALNIELLDISDRFKSDKVIIDIITLDSASCAPCQYMVEAVKHASEKFGDKVEYNEFKIKDKEGVQMMASLGVSNLPTICIDGEVKFISQIPPQKDLIEAIESFASKK